MVTAATHLMTLDEWAALDEDTPGELVDGVLVEEEMPSVLHEIVVAWLLVALTHHFDPRGGLVLPSGVKLAVRPRRGRLADIVVFAKGRKPPPRGLVRIPPDIAVEVVSAERTDERRDRIEKPDDYAAFGVGYYWIVDPEIRSFEIWELGADGRYVRAAAAIGGRLESVPGCEGLLLDVDALWAKLDAALAG